LLLLLVPLEVVRVVGVLLGPLVCLVREADTCRFISVLALMVAGLHSSRFNKDV
jgi:hypothetical protein